LARRRTVDLVRAAEEVVHGHVVPADAVREPAGIGHLAERVHVERGPERARRLGKGVGQELVRLGQVVFRGLGNRPHVVVVPEGIVRIEPQRSAARQHLRRRVRQRQHAESGDQNGSD
jgi:hypothetical protein